MDFVGKNIRRIRKQAKLSQAELAELVGVSTPRISEIERGSNVTLRTLVTIARALNVTVARLVKN